MKHHYVATAPPPGTPFHHLAGTGFAPLRVFAAILTGVAGVIAITQIPGHDVLSLSWTSHGIPAMPLFGPDTAVMSWQAETALALTLLLAAVLVISGARLRTSLSVAGRVRWPWLCTCTLTAFVVLGVLAVAGYGTELLRPGNRLVFPGRPATREFVLAAALVVLAGVYAIALELLFRGWYLQMFGAEQPAWLAIAGQAVMCTISHVPRQTVWGYADLAAYAVLAGWLTISAGGTEATIAFAVAWNATLIADTVLITGHPAPSYGGFAVSSGHFAIHLTAALAYAVVVRRNARRRRQAIATVTDVLSEYHDDGAGTAAGFLAHDGQLHAVPSLHTQQARTVTAPARHRAADVAAQAHPHGAPS